MIVKYIKNIPKDRQFYYLCTLISIIWFFNNAYTPTVGFVVGLTMSIIYIYYNNEVVVNDVGNLNNELHYKLNSLLDEEGIDSPEYFYLDPDVINFFYSIRDFRIYNRDSYVKSIKTTNLLLKMKKDLENDYKYYPKTELDSWQNHGYIEKPRETNNIKNLKEIFEISDILGKKTINYIHSFVVTLPTAYTDKHSNALKRIHIIIKRNLDDILAHCKKNSNDPLIGQDYGLPKPYVYEDQSINNFNFIS
jgi:hypothetical protein